MFLMDALLVKRREISERIKAVLAERGWSQNQLAEAMGVPRSYVTRILTVTKTSSPPTLRTIVAIEKALQASIIDISRSQIKELTEK
jgi:transcriptional regulator with XRE-family HTH domain